MNTNMNSFQFIMLISSLVLSIQLVPQNYKIYKSKSAKDISYITICITLSGISGIMTYGIHEELIEIWAPPIVQIILTLHMFFMKVYYDNFYEQPEPEEDMYIREEIDRSMNSHISIGITGMNSDSIDYKFK